MTIPFYSLEAAHSTIKADMMEAFASVYSSNWYVLGRAVEQFEAEYAAFSGTRHCIGTSNGLDALLLCLKALQAGPGDEVIVPSNTFIASVLAVLHSGATPVFAEPDYTTFNISAAAAEAAITPRTKVLMPVHLYGQCCNMEAVMQLADRYGIAVVEDNAQSQGAAFCGRPAGSFGNAAATSFYPAKNLGALGDAGAITTNDDALAAQVRLLRNYGSQVKYQHEAAGYNMRLDELQAAFLSVKLRHLAEWTAQRRQAADWYTAALAGIGDLVLPETAPGATHVYHLYVVRSRHRSALQQYLQQQGIGTMIHYPIPPHLQPACSQLGYDAGAFPVAEAMAATSLSLPLYPGLQQEQVQYIASAIHSFFNRL